VDGFPTLFRGNFRDGCDTNTMLRGCCYVAISTKRCGMIINCDAVPCLILGKLQNRINEQNNAKLLRFLMLSHVERNICIQVRQLSVWCERIYGALA
jgi:hypothetical protein